jgi:YD repeat-containing protein
MMLDLVSIVGNHTLPASQVVYQDDSTLYATFNLQGVATGAYTLVASNGPSGGTASAPFTVTASPAGALSIQIETPDGIRPDFLTPVTVVYTNTGGTDIPAPLIGVTADTAMVRLASATTFLGDSVDFLAVDPSGPAGVLPPGTSGSLDLVIETTNLSAATVNIAAGAVNPSQAVEWSDLAINQRPSYASASAWATIVANLSSSIGSTAGDLQAALDANATYLSSLGERTSDIDTLLGLDFLNADAALAFGTFGTLTDASVPIPGELSLDVTRKFLVAINGRNSLGPFGRGWTDEWDITASADRSGNVTIQNGGEVRVFTRLADGSFQPQPGDFGTFTSLSAGGWELQEQDGTIETYNANGTLDYEQEAGGDRITAAYDGSNELTSLAASSGQSLSLAYNTAGLVASITDSYGRITSYSYDPSNQYLLSVSTPQGTTRYTYQEATGSPTANALTSITSADGTELFFTYDAMGRVASVSENGGAEKVTLSYAEPGEVMVTDALGDTEQVEFNQAGEVARTVDPLGNVSSFSYDPASLLLTQITDLQGETWTYSYDTAGNLASATDALGQTRSFTYGVDNRLTAMTDAAGNTTSYSYDSSGNLLATTLPDGATSTSTFNPLGEPITYVNAGGQSISSAYNAHGQLTQETFSDGTSYSYAYDSHGDLITATGASGTTTFTYNSADELTKVSYPGGDFLQFTLNAAGERTRMVDQTGFTVNYQYTATGQLAGLTDAAGNAIVAYTYNSVGRLVRTDNGNVTVRRNHPSRAW